MQKPQLKDFTGNRQEKSRKYTAALNKWKKSQKDSSGKRTSYVDILGFKWKKEGNKYVQYRGDGTKTGKTRPYDINANKKNTRRGKRPDNNKKKQDLKVKKKEPYAADKVGYVDKNSKEYKAAVEMTNRNPIKKEEKKVESNVGPVADGKKYADSLGNKKKYKQVSQKELDAEIAKRKNPKPEVKKPVKKTKREKFNEKFIRTKKGTLARRGSVTARRAENREAARKRAQAAAKLKIKKKKEKEKK